MLGRQLSVFKNSNKNPVWVKGAVKAFDAPSVRHKVTCRLGVNLELWALYT